MTEQEFKQLLGWLDPDASRAGEKYEVIRRKLIIILLNRGCDEAEDLADETINRVARKVPELKDTYVGEPARYFHGVAKRVLWEYFRARTRKLEMPPPAPSREELEPYLECLDRCLAQLSAEDRELILLYYEGQKQSKIITRREMGGQMQLKAGALRARAFRLRGKLEKCVLECLALLGESNDIKFSAI